MLVPALYPKSRQADWVRAVLRRPRGMSAGQEDWQAPQPTQRPAKWKARTMSQDRLPMPVAALGNHWGWPFST